MQVYKVHLTSSKRQPSRDQQWSQCLSISVPKSLRGPPSQHTCWPKLLIAWISRIVRSLGRIINRDRVWLLAQCKWSFSVSAVVQQRKKTPKLIRSINTSRKLNNAKCLKHFSLGRLDFTRYKSFNLFLAQKSHSGRLCEWIDVYCLATSFEIFAFNWTIAINRKR